MATVWTALAAEAGGAFVISAMLAVWARRGFPMPIRRAAKDAA